MKKLHGHIIVFVLLFFAAPLFAQQLSQSTAPLPNKRVLIISMDGMRPDVLLRANMPNIRNMFQRGSFSLWAESTNMAETLPSHVSMLTGLSPARHHITWNDERKMEPGMSLPITLFDLVKKRGYKTSMVVSKRKLCLIAQSDTGDCERPLGIDTALGIAERASIVVRERRPELLFVHFSDLDAAGHTYGWGTLEQIVAAENVDKAIGMLLSTYREVGIYDQTLVLVTADHGGSGRTHGEKVPYSHYIPWIAIGPGVRENYDLTLEQNPLINIEDVFATALYFFDIGVPENADGKPVLGMFQKTEKRPAVQQ